MTFFFLKLLVFLQISFVTSFTIIPSIHHNHILNRITSSSSSFFSPTITTAITNSNNHKSSIKYTPYTMRMKSIMQMDTKYTNNDNHHQNICENNITTSLASSYLIIHDTDTDTDTNNDRVESTITWTLLPLETIHNDNNDNNEMKIPIGTRDIKALEMSSSKLLETIKSNNNKNKNEMIQLTCKIIHPKDDDDDDDDVDNTLVIQVTTIHNNIHDDDDDNEHLQLLLSTLSIIMIQKHIQENNVISSLPSNTTTSISLSLPSLSESNNNNNNIVSYSYNIHDILSSSNNGCCNPLLYQSLLPSTMDLNNIEMSDMVDSKGNVLGSLPRYLVHKLNILHRGIGIIVCNNDHIITKTTTLDDNDNDHTTTTTAHNNTSSSLLLDNASIYCHQRTSTKKIFPSLYDMFVGGVSISGEDAILTACREVGEELGLQKALQCIEVGDTFLSPLSDPLFQCTVCTSYNRCVVTVFTYKYLGDEETIRWQEEEVSWGEFVNYRVVEKAAELSIKRLIDDEKWPGTGHDDYSLFDSSTDSRYSKLEFKTDSKNDDDDIIPNPNTWDFVPDGLLVWVAWLKWINKEI